MQRLYKNIGRSTPARCSYLYTNTQGRGSFREGRGRRHFNNIGPNARLLLRPEFFTLFSRYLYLSLTRSAERKSNCFDRVSHVIKRI